MILIVQQSSMLRVLVCIPSSEKIVKFLFFNKNVGNVINASNVGVTINRNSKQNVTIKQCFSFLIKQNLSFPTAQTTNLNFL